MESRSSAVRGAVLLTLHLDFAAESGTISLSVTTRESLCVFTCRDVFLTCGAAKAHMQANDSIMYFTLFNGALFYSIYIE